MTRWAWPSVAALALTFIAVLAFHGKRPEPGLARFEPGGLLVGWPAAEMASVEITAGGQHRSFERVPRGWRPEAGGEAPPDLTERIERGLQLLHDSKPERIFRRDELAGGALEEFGLTPPRLSVTARTGSGRSITVHFGGPNPLGLARYAQVQGEAEVALLSGFVAEAWEQVAARR